MSAPYVSPFPPLTPYEREVMEILIEECLEVGQRGTKMLRFGAQEIQPGQPLDNIARLSQEIGNLQHMIKLAAQLNLVDWDHIGEGIIDKKKQLAKYMQHQRDEGSVKL
jgi:hypothetical protein